MTEFTSGTIRSLRFLVLGSLNMDYILQADHEPDDDGSVWLSASAERPGGHAGNCAAALAALGTQVTVLGAVGRDAGGTAIIDGLVASQVDVKRIRRTGNRTGRVYIPTFPSRRYMLMDRGANDDLCPDDLPAAMPRCDAILVFDPPTDVLDALASTHFDSAASSHTPLFCWNPGGRYAHPSMRQFAVDRFELLVLNRNEYHQMFGADSPCLASIGRDDHETVVTRGRGGACLYSRDGTTVEQAVPVDAVDPTGAGDAFCAAMAVARVVGLQVRDRLRFANTVGALATRATGAWASLPSFVAAANAAQIAVGVNANSDEGVSR